MPDWKYTKNITLGYADDGTRIRKRLYANSPQELKRLERDALATSDYNKSSDVTFGEYSRKWLEVYKTNKSHSTYYGYKVTLDKLSPLNLMPIRNIKQIDLQYIVNEYWDSRRTCELLNTTLHQIFTSASSDKLIAPFPFKLELPPKISKEKRPLTDEEKQAIQNIELPPQYKMFVNISYSLGLRPEETRALKESDFDYKNMTVSILRAASFGGDLNVPTIKNTKNEKHRQLPLSQSFLDAIKGYCRTQKHDYLFCNEDGGLWTRSQYQTFTKTFFRTLNKMLGGDSKHDMLNGMTMYTLRHNKATELYYLTGISTKKKAEYMGHTEQMFLQTYSHLDNSREEIEVLREVCSL